MARLVGDSLIAEGLAVMRGGRQVVAPLSLALEPGTITAICGPNGAGKSSLVLALAGLLRPAAGTVRLGETDCAALPSRERARAIGYLPQGCDIAWDVSVERLVALGRHPHGDASGPAGRRAIEAALGATQLGDLRRARVSALSGGERARVLLARVLAGSPQWILADEPLAALDLAHQLRMIAHLKDCTQGGGPGGGQGGGQDGGQDGGQGVVIVLHDLALAMNHADRVVVLGEGALIADGPPEVALAASVIAQVWGVEARWLGDAGARALIPLR